MLLREIIKELNLQILSGQDNIDLDVTYAYSSDILSDVMAKTKKDCLWITNQTHQNVIAIIFFKGLSGAILAGDVKPDEETLSKAKAKNIPVFQSHLSAFELAGKLYGFGIRGID